MKRKIGLTATPMPKNWVRALYIICRRKLRKIDSQTLVVIVCTVIFLVQMLIMITALKAQEKPKGLSIGDEVPDVTITNIINYKTSTAKISDFKGKLLILDFWATWCGACLNTFPLTDSLQKQFEDKIQFFPVTYQLEEEIRPFMEKMEKNRGIRFFTSAGNKELRKLFPHQTFPHYVWIGADGTVKAITGPKALSAENIRAMLSQDDVQLRVKKDVRIPYDFKRPLFVHNNGGDGSKTIYRSVFSRYVAGLKGGTSIYKPDTATSFRITTLNQPVVNLFRVAFSDHGYLPNNRIVVSVADTTKVNSSKTGAEYLDWLKDRGYCYELTVPVALEKQAFEMMRSDLKKLLPEYIATMEKQDTRCLALVRTSKTDKLKSRGGKSSTSFNAFGCTLQNFPLHRFIDQLNINYLQSAATPVVDQTGYTAWVDMVIDAPLTSIPELNRELAKYDLQLVEKVLPVDKLVIRDHPVKGQSAAISE